MMGALGSGMYGMQQPQRRSQFDLGSGLYGQQAGQPQMQQPQQQMMHPQMQFGGMQGEATDVDSMGNKPQQGMPMPPGMMQMAMNMMNGHKFNMQDGLYAMMGMNGGQGMQR